MGRHLTANHPHADGVHEELAVDGSEPELLVVSIDERLAGVQALLEGNHDGCLAAVVPHVDEPVGVDGVERAHRRVPLQLFAQRVEVAEDGRYVLGIICLGTGPLLLVHDVCEADAVR